MTEIPDELSRVWRDAHNQSKRGGPRQWALLALVFAVALGGMILVAYANPPTEIAVALFGVAVATGLTILSMRLKRANELIRHLTPEP